MLYELQQAMLQALDGLHAGRDVIEAYQKRWRDTVEGLSRTFPCPACFMAGVTDSELKPLPAKGNMHCVSCKTCSRQYCYEDTL